MASRVEIGLGDLPAILQVEMTTVVAVITQDELVVGADSKVMWQVKGEFEETACKIYQVGNRFFSFAGLGGDVVSGFMVSDIATKAIQSGKTFPEILTNFDLQIQFPLYQQFQMLQINHPRVYAQLQESGGPLDAIFFGYEDNQFHLYAQFYGTDEKRSFGMRPTATSPGVIILGYGKALGKLIEADERFWDVGFVPAIHHLLEIAIQDNPALVGPPIYVLRITREKAEWIERAPHCPDIQPYSA